MSKVKNELKKDALMPLRHSTEHILHTAVESLFPGAQKVMGPPIKDGFYGDFDYDEKISMDDLGKIEDRMKEIIKADLPLSVREISYNEIKEIFKDNPYKLEMIENLELKDEKVSICELGKEGDKFHDIDLCEGPHLHSTGEVKTFKLLNIAGAYWRGDEKNKMLTRIYATAFKSQKDLEKYLKLLEEQEKRNHRKIGKEMELFAIFPEMGKGLPVWLPNGYVMRRELENYMLDVERNYGYKHMLSPVIHKDELFNISGHLDFYKKDMYAPLEIDDETYYLKPMNCPAGMLVYKMKPRSYRDLPMRIGEFGTVYRYERSGKLDGLQRVRGFTQNDAHIYCTGKQLEKELDSTMEMYREVYKVLGFDNYSFVLATSDETSEKFKECGTREDWLWAEEKLRNILKKAKVEFTEEKGDAAFYGPKIDVEATNIMGKKDAISTIQVDFNLPERFKLKYIDEKGNEIQPFVIHRALVGSFERFFAFLIEHYGGAFPVWLAPTQVQIIPIADKHVDYANEVAEELQNKKIRVEVDDKQDTIGAKIRNAQLKKVPYMLIIGDREMKDKQVSVRLRNNEDLGAKPTNEVIEKIEEMYLTKSLKLW